MYLAPQKIPDGSNQHADTQKKRENMFPSFSRYYKNLFRVSS